MNATHPSSMRVVPQAARLPSTPPEQNAFPRRRISQPATRERPLRLLSLDDIATLQPPEWLIDRFIPADALVVLYGEPKIGKSFVSLDWALSIAAGRSWFGRGTKGGDVIYIYAEGVTGLRSRTDAWAKERGLRPERFRAVPSAVTVPDEDEIDAFVSVVRSTKCNPRLIVLDTLARNFGLGDENKPQDMNAFVRGCDALRVAFPGATVLVVHHCGKDKNKGARGSMVLTAAADTVLCLRKSGKMPWVRLITEHQKDGEPADDIALMLKPVQLGENLSSCIITMPNIVVPTFNHEREDPRPAQTDERVLEALRSFGARGATSGELVEAAGQAKGTVYASRKRLIARGIAQREGSRFYVTDGVRGPIAETVQNVVQFPT